MNPVAKKSIKKQYTARIITKKTRKNGGLPLTNQEKNNTKGKKMNILLFSGEYDKAL